MISQDGCDFWNSSTLPYSYSLDDVTTVQETVQKYAGFGDNPTACAYDIFQTGKRRVAGRIPASIKTVLHLSDYSMIEKSRWVKANIYDINGRKLKPSVLSTSSGTHGVVILRETQPR